jgi:hypothetical protein
MAMSSSYEQLMEKLPSKAVMDAVVDAKQGDKVIASDVATRAGVSLTQARKDLTALASLSRGDISVSSDGELLYEFPANLPTVLSANSAKYKALQVFENVWPTVFWGIRVSFGVALLASVVLIFSAIFFIQTSSSSSDDDRRRDDRRGGFGGGGMNMMFGPSPFDFFFYRPYGSYGYYAENKDPSEMGFLESIFSYIFGDGNPNQGLEERRLSLAAQMIRDHNGAVTAEQLAPYCDAPEPSDDQGSSSAYVDESFMLPIVTQLDGEPRVTDDGDIIYVFPELQVSASSSRIVPKASESSMILKRAGLPSNASSREIQQLLYRNGINSRGALGKEDLLKILETALPPMTPQEEGDLLEEDPSILQERQYKFSLAPDMYKFFAGGLGIVNLGGALYLGNLLNQYALYNVQLPGILGLTQSLYPLLFGYAVLFNAIPLVRNLWIGAQNSKIQQRNQTRKQWRQKLESRVGNVGRKLKAAAKFSTNRKQLKAEDVVYDSKTTSASDLGVVRNQQDLDDFDQLLDNKNNDDDNSSVFQ